MKRVSTIGLDLAKSVFQAHGADSSGAVIFREKLPRTQMLEYPIKPDHSRMPQSNSSILSA